MYLPEILVPAEVLVTSDLGESVLGRSVWVVATPSHAVRILAERLQPYVREDVIVVSVAKGIEGDTLMTGTQVLGSVLTPPVPASQIGVLSGPSHAEEVAVGKPTTLVASAPDLIVAETIQAVFMSPHLRVYVNEDLVGVEMGGSVKNVMAIAAGIGDGIGYGDNAKAALLTRGMAEIQRLGVVVGADPATFAGLTGIGDLVVTCTSRHSRNRRLGEMIGKGMSLAEATASMQMVAEGVRTTAATRALARKLGIDMPITEAVYAILFEDKRPVDAVRDLMTRAAKREDWLPDTY